MNIGQIHHVRTSILEEWIALSKAAIDEAFHGKEDAPLPPCGKATCKATKIGILLMGLEAAGLFPIPESAQTMYRSVEWYWKALKEIGTAFKDYKPCDGQLGYGKGNHHSSCGYEKCLGDFGLLTKAKDTLTKYGQKEVMRQLLGVSLA